MILPLCVEVLCLVFVMHFLVYLIVLQRPRRGREGWLSSCCHVAVSVLCLFLKVPWIGLRYVIVTFPCTTYLHL